MQELIAILNAYLITFSSVIGYYPFLPYLIIFFTLTLCGIGLPVPEDIILIVAGLFVFYGLANLYFVIIISIIGVIAGDCLIFYIGRRWGIWFLRHKIFKGAFSEERVAKVHDYFDKYGNKTVFFGRFFWGLRTATFFIAGTHTMNIFKFVAFDLLGALISIPIIIYLSYYFGAEIETAGISMIKQAHHVILFVMVLAIAFLLIRHYLRKKRNKNNIPE